MPGNVRADDDSRDMRFPHGTSHWLRVSHDMVTDEYTQYVSDGTTEIDEYGDEVMVWTEVGRYRWATDAR